MSTENHSSGRIASIDILRGFDMLMIIFVEHFVIALNEGFETPFTMALEEQFEHPEWLGSTFYDIIMPLFLFVVGAVIPFSIGKKLEQKTSYKAIYKKLGKRFLILFVLGWIVQGNLLALEPENFYIFNNTLQAIAVGYVFSVLAYIHLPLKGCFLLFFGCLLAYMLALILPIVPGYGSNNIVPDGNYAIFLDRWVMGGLHDGSQYTWLLSGMGFTATTLSGLFAGSVIKSSRPRKKTFSLLFIFGFLSLISGLIIGQFHPIVKKIWTSSFVLFSSGICFMLMALFYYIVDIKKSRKWAFPLKVIGMNAITAYVLSHIVDFPEIANYVLFGFEPYLGSYYDILLTLGGFGILYLLLWYMFRNKTFIRV